MALWEGLLRDIDTGCRRCAAAIAQRRQTELGPHRRRAIEALSQIEAGVDVALGELATHDGDLAGLAELGVPFDVFRHDRLPFFAHYGANEHYLTLLAARISDEAGFPIATPIVGTFSQSGYWTNPELRTICLPAGEHNQLLAFPDLVHELAHMLLHEIGGELSVEFLAKAVVPYSQRLGTIAGDNGFGLRLYRQYRIWHVELVADAIATYVCGPSYGWEHIRLSAQSGALARRDLAQPWHPATPDEVPQRFPHPADTARTTLIATVLHNTGQQTSATALNAQWTALTRHAGTAPATYAATYPDRLLETLAEMTLAWCRENDLVAFANSRAGAVVGHIDRAWTQQLADPGAFGKDEAQRVAALRALVKR
jgi:hypothetical protein